MDLPALHIDRGDVARIAALPVRGVGWVLRWAAAIAVLACATSVVATFTLQLSAEAALRRAATAGLREASLPRATCQSVAAVVRQRLAAQPRLLRGVQLQLAANGIPIRGVVPSGDLSRLSLTLTVPASNALPRSLALFAGDSPIRVTAGDESPATIRPAARLAAPLTP